MSADQYYNVENIKFFETYGGSEYYALIKAKNKEEARETYQNDVAEVSEDYALEVVEIPMDKALGKYMKFIIEDGDENNMYISWVTKDLKIHMEHIMSDQPVPLLIDKALV